MDLVLKLRDLVNAIRAGNYLAAAALAGSIIAIITEALTTQTRAGNPVAMSAAMASSESQTVEEIADSLEAHANAASGPAIDLLLPILLVLLRKLLGF